MPLQRTFPAYRQLDPQDNGPTCIKILADHFQTGATWTGIRDWMADQEKAPTNLIDLARGLEHHGMSVRWMLRSPNTLPRKGATPLIVPWPGNHFVIIHKIGRRLIHLIDPAQGRRTITRWSFGQYWAPKGTGMALSVSPKIHASQKRRSPWAALYLTLIIAQHP